MKSHGSVGCGFFLALFGLPFAAAGFGTTVFLYLAVFRWADAQSWQETPATIQSVEVEDRGSTTSTEATFQYDWEGVSMTSDWVTIHPGSDNIGDFQQRIAAELTHHHKTGKPFRCFVNPTDPSQAILYRELRWQMLSFLAVFGTIFTTVGSGIFVGSLRSVPEFRRVARLKSEFPDEPWYWKSDWADEVIQGEGSSKWVPVIAGWWMFVTFPGGVGAVHALTLGNPFGLAGLILPVLSLLIVRGAIRGEVRRRAFGLSRLSLNRFPAITGGTMTGELLIEKHVAPHTIWKLTLTGETQYDQGDDTRRSTVFEESVSAASTETSSTWGHSAIPFEFVIPYGAPQTEPEGRVRSEWKLKVIGRGGEVDYEDSFVIPVFETEESVPDVISGPADETEYPAESDDGLIQARLLVQDHVDGSWTVIAPVRRYLGMILSLSIFCLIWDGIACVLFLQNAPMIFQVAFGGSAVALTWILIDLLVRSARFYLDADSLTFRNGWPLISRERRLDLADLQEVSAKATMSSNESQFYSVVVTPHVGKPLTIMSLIRGKDAAETIVERIRKSMKET